MPFSLTIGTERATALQKSIQDELTRREYSADAGQSFSLLCLSANFPDADDMYRSSYGRIYYYHDNKQQDCR